MSYLDGGRWALVDEFTEIESGKRNDRLELVKALAACKKKKAKLVIAKLDRLSRNLAFIATLIDSGVEFIAVDNPHANKLTIHILAAVAEHEREIISARTSAALQAAKARGKRLGNPKLSEARRHATAARKDKADRYSANVLPLIREIQRSGIQSLRGIARALAARGVPTARGGAWTPVQVSDILRRAGLCIAAKGRVHGVYSSPSPARPSIIGTARPVRRVRSIAFIAMTRFAMSRAVIW